ncbi:lipase maturation factor 1 isoform X2 [Bos indicus]|uniref:Lipase maturation factor n=1 Tax=Bos indicus TaxID=9915 RepID=A0ABM4RIV5_BOSIN
MRHNRCPTLWPTSCTAPRGGSTASRPSATTSWSWWCPFSSSSDGGCASSTGPCRSCSSSGSAARVDSGRRCGTRTLGREEPELDPERSGQLVALDVTLKGQPCTRLPSSKALGASVQVVLIISGNLSFLNWLTIVPSLACFDDATLGALFPSGPGRLKDQVLKIQEEETRGASAPRTRGSVARGTVNLALGILVAWLSIPVVLNLLSPRQVMNSSFNPLRIVNTYGAFGSITRERTEVILQGTASANASAPDSAWEDYEFKCKPGDPRRRPCLISPYHHRLDWLMWFAAFQTYEHNEWIIHLAGKLLANDAQALSLLARNPFEGRDPPRWVRGEHYRYKFSRPGGRHAAEGKWWIRRRLGPYFPPLSRQDLRGYFTSRQWPYPEPE